jgi:hypothetical protein
MSYQFIAKRRTLGSVLLIALLIVAVTATFSVMPSSSVYADDSNALPKVQIALGERSETAVFEVTGSGYPFLNMAYTVKKSVSVTYPGVSHPTEGYIKDIHLQRKDGGEWVTIDTQSKAGVGDTSIVASVTFSISQKTSASTEYRIHVPADNYVSETASDSFKISGPKQNSGLSVKYSAAKQKYNKSAVTLTIKTSTKNPLLAGKVTIYDGTKKLKSIEIKENSTGSVKYKLSSKLKAGTHKITVKFTPSTKCKPFYAAKTTAVKKIVVTK